MEALKRVMAVLDTATCKEVGLAHMSGCLSLPEQIHHTWGNHELYCFKRLHLTETPLYKAHHEVC